MLDKIKKHLQKCATYAQKFDDFDEFFDFVIVSYVKNEEEVFGEEWEMFQALKHEIFHMYITCQENEYGEYEGRIFSRVLKKVYES